MNCASRGSPDTLKCQIVSLNLRKETQKRRERESEREVERLNQQHFIASFRTLTSAEAADYNRVGGVCGGGAGGAQVTEWRDGQANKYFFSTWKKNRSRRKK